MSLASTGGLAALFAVTSPSSTGEVQSAAVVIGPTAAVSAAGDTSTPATIASSALSSTSSSSASSSSGSSPAANPVTVPVTIPAANPTPSTSSTPSTTIAASPVVVDGAVFHNRWGDVQVEATFSPDGALIDVAALRTPNNRSYSVQLNNYAVPRLTAEALSAQTARVDTVTGATYTSNDYRKSLQSAIDAAVQAGITVAVA
jgi:uncharacterized protein with FMN-binding domain